MEYLRNIFGCCCSNDVPGIKINFQSTCCKAKAHNIIITDENDIEKIKTLLEDLQKKQNSNRITV